MVFIPKKTAIQFVPIQQSTLFLHEAQHPEGLCPARRLTAGACGVPPAPQLGFRIGRGRAAPVSLPRTGPSSRGSVTWPCADGFLLTS